MVFINFINKFKIFPANIADKKKLKNINEWFSMIFEISREKVSKLNIDVAINKKICEK